MKSIRMDEHDFGLLCVCALRDCQGRKTYMPSLVQGIVKGTIKHISDADLKIMLDDCDFQRRANLYGNERIDKPCWLNFEQFLKDEAERRKKSV